VLILALDTTTPEGSTAVLRDEEVLALQAGDGSRTHGERLPKEIEITLARAGVAMHAIDLLAVASGPGGFTGLRIGLAAMQGLAMTLARPVVGVSALEALAWAARESLAAADQPAVAAAPGPYLGGWIDARRGDVFAALFDGHLSAIDPPSAAPPDVVIARWQATVPEAWQAGRLSVTGDGAARYGEALRAAGGHVVPTPLLAPFIGRIGRVRAAAGLAGPPHAIAPLYVRRPDAELDRDRRQTR
jgi:tRNA threonylcarbamoyladenosine biosynthesis protein TsaB